MYGLLDFMLTISKENILVETSYIEVKTTEAGEQNITIAHFSTAQIEAMIQCGSKYNLYRVYSAGTKEARLENTQDPWQQLKNDKLEVATVGIKI